MAETILSRYKNYVVASKAKVFLSSFADYLLTFILTFLLFAIAGSPILSALPVTQDSYAQVATHVDALYTMIDEAHLQSYNKENGTLSSVRLDAVAYATRLARSSYYVLDLPYPYLEDAAYVNHKVPLEETFFLTGDTPYLYDSPSYYFLHYKTTDPSISSYVYEGVDYATKKEEYLYLHAFGFDENWFETVDDHYSKFHQLTKEKAELLAAYLAYEDNAPGPKQTYETVINGYRNAIESFIDEFQYHYAPFVAENETFYASVKEYDGVVLLIYALCFLVALSILEGILPLFLKEGRTIAMRAMKLSYATTEELTPSWWRFLIKSLMRILLHFSGVFFCVMLTSSLSLVFVSFGWFNVFMPLLVSAILGVASTVLLLARKDTQGIGELLAGLLVKDTTTMEAGEASEEGGEHGRE